MRQFRIRFTIRRLMLGVVLVALLLGSGRVLQIYKRHRLYEKASALYARESRNHRARLILENKIVEETRAYLEQHPDDEWTRATLEEFQARRDYVRRCMAWSTRMERRYHDLAYHPWQPQTIDPPRPREP